MVYVARGYLAERLPQVQGMGVSARTPPKKNAAGSRHRTQGIAHPQVRRYFSLQTTWVPHSARRIGWVMQKEVSPQNPSRKSNIGSTERRSTVRARCRLGQSDAPGTEASYTNCLELLSHAPRFQ
jgi:hypothetical protein